MSDEISRGMLSVIVPLYNAEKYIEKCLISLCNQTYQNIEVLVIDDGSTDNGKQTVKYLMKKYDNINLIEQNNAGVSKARNVGIEISKGEYVTFVDADDYLETNVYSTIMHKMIEDDVDATVYAFERIYGEGIREYSPLPWMNGTILSNEEIRKELIPLMISGIRGRKSISGSVCRTVFKKNAINNYLFDESIRIQEDLLYCIRTYARMRNILILNEVKYYYVRHSGTTIEHYRVNYYDESKKFENAIVIALQENELFEDLNDRYFSKRMGMYSLCISNLFRNDAPGTIENEFKEILRGFACDEYIKQKHKHKYNYLDKKMIVLYWLMNLKMGAIIRIIYSLKEKRRHKNLTE